LGYYINYDDFDLKCHLLDLQQSRKKQVGKKSLQN